MGSSSLVLLLLPNPVKLKGIHFDVRSLGSVAHSSRPAQRSIMSFAPDMLHLIVRTRSPHNKRNLFVSLAAVSDFLFSTSIVAPPPHHKSGWGGGRPSFHVLSCDSSAVNAVYCKGWKIFRQSFCNFSCLLPAGWSIGVSNNKSGFRRENRHKGDNIRRYQIQCRTKQSISIYVGPPSRDGMSFDNASWACVGQWVPRSLLHVLTWNRLGG